MSMQYLGALRGEDAIAEGWVAKRGRSTLFCEAVAVGASSGRDVAHALMTFQLVGSGTTGATG
jgi:acyl-coenzyme A thioesterase PaaI-like protein